MTQIRNESFSLPPRQSPNFSALQFFFKKYLEDMKLPYNFAPTLQEWLMV